MAPKEKDVSAQKERKTAHIKSLIDNTLNTGHLDPGFCDFNLPDSFKDPLAIYQTEKHCSLSTMFEIFYKEFDNETQECFKDALTRRTNDWSLDRDGLAKLDVLALTSYGINASGVVSSLAKFTENDLTPNRRAGEIGEVERHVVNVVAGFAGAQRGSKEALKIVERWSSKPEYDLFAGTFCNILLSAEPDKYPKHLNRFFELVKAHPENFIIQYCLLEMIRRVTPEVIKAHLDELSPEVRGMVLESMKTKSRKTRASK